MVMTLCKHMPALAVARHVDEHDTLIWRIIHHYVDAAYVKTSWQGMKTIAIDETSAKKGHRYVTVVVDVDSPEVEQLGHARLIFMAEGRDAKCVGEFVEQMPLHQAEPKQIDQAALDMGKAYLSGVATHLPNAKVCLDRFHVMQLVGKAIDEVRRWLQSAGHDLKGSLWALRGNAAHLRPKLLETRARLCKEHRELARAFALRDELQAMWDYKDEVGADGQITHTARTQAKEHLDKWLSWAQRSRLESFVKLARTLKTHGEKILNYYPSYLTSAAAESINGLLQTARRRAKGFRSFSNFRAIAYWVAGHLNPFDSKVSAN
jgi:transposase